VDALTATLRHVPVRKVGGYVSKVTAYDSLLLATIEEGLRLPYSPMRPPWVR
jgi:hypothetical protein